MDSSAASGGDAAGSYAIPSYNTHNLKLDPSIRDWVVLPLLVIMIAAGLLRTYLGQLLRAKSRKIDPTEARGRSDLQRAKRLVGGGGGYLDPAAATTPGRAASAPPPMPRADSCGTRPGGPKSSSRSRSRAPTPSTP